MLKFFSKDEIVNSRISWILKRWLFWRNQKYRSRIFSGPEQSHLRSLVLFCRVHHCQVKYCSQDRYDSFLSWTKCVQLFPHSNRFCSNRQVCKSIWTKVIARQKILRNLRLWISGCRINKKKKNEFQALSSFMWRSGFFLFRLSGVVNLT